MCEDQMDQLQVLRLLSMAKFNAGFLQCNQSFGKECVGPSKTIYEQRMVKMLGKSKSSFIKEYNHRLFNWLVAFSLVMVIVGRFIKKFILIEIGAWILFIFLETYTRMFWSPESLHYNPVWHGIVATWETLVYSPVLDLDRLEDCPAMPVERIGFMLQPLPHGFFNYSLAVDVPLGAYKLDVKDSHVKDTIGLKPISNGLIAEL
ncbi:putative primary-amine oxidase [Helianthus annuus]|nr:putative primary-amine oxidase [Helianthus annuus]KAJ0617872.1 putative primary-amine oxidase [Helianthus annuus]